MIRRRSFIGGATALLAVERASASAATPVGAIVDRFAREHGFNGVVAHGTGGRRDFLAAFGQADVAARRPVTAATRFAFGSASKLLTAVAILRLVEQGRLDLDRPITAWLPTFRADTGARLTLRRLLSNTSGLPDRLSQAARTDPALRASTEGSAAMVARFADGDLAFPPGTAWDYAMLNWVVVHAIVERATGWPFAVALDRLIFRPLGMASAGLVDTIGGRTAATASAYASLAPSTPKMAGVPPFAGASGNVFATADDAIRAAHGAFGGRLLSARSRAALTRVEWEPERYALGVRMRSFAGRDWAWAPGKIDGYRALIAHQLVGGRTVAIFNNTDMDQSALARLAEAMILG